MAAAPQTTATEITEIQSALRSAGMRWTPQRRMVLEALLASGDGHITGADLVARVQRLDPDTPASTVYRTLDMLERLGYVLHSHGADGREEFHVMPDEVHAHLSCTECGKTWEVPPSEISPLTEQLARTRGFAVNLSHLTVSGLCRECADRD